MGLRKWLWGQSEEGAASQGVQEPLLHSEADSPAPSSSAAASNDAGMAAAEPPGDDHIGHDGSAPARPAKPAKMSWFAWLLLAAALTVKSSAGAVFASLHDVGALTKSAWRMQLAAAIMLPVAVWQYRRAPASVKATVQRKLWRLIASGVLLAVQWAAYAWAVGHTSLAHTLLFLSATPVLLAGWHWVSRQPISAGELGGCGVGVAGAAILSLAAGSSGSSSPPGDSAALAGAAANGASLSIGRLLLLAPYHVPVFTYSCVVTGTAGVVLTLLSVVAEGASFTHLGATGVFGWLARPYLLRGVYLSLGPGLFGHVGFNFLMTYESMSPLVLSLAQTLDPPIGSLLGWAAGLMAAPSSLTYLGGGVLLGATVGVTLAGAARRRREAAEGALAALKTGPGADGAGAPLLHPMERV